MCAEKHKVVHLMARAYDARAWQLGRATHFA
jgi:hypothetical protein